MEYLNMWETYTSNKVYTRRESVMLQCGPQGTYCCAILTALNTTPDQPLWYRENGYGRGWGDSAKQAYKEAYMYWRISLRDK